MSEISRTIQPSVSQILKSTTTERELDKKISPNNISEFQDLIKKINTTPEIKNQNIEISQHAAKRLEERNLTIDGDEYLKLREAIDKVRNKGGQNSLVISDKAAYIVDIANNKIITAMDKNQLEENVFTKIDSTVFMN